MRIRYTIRAIYLRMVIFILLSILITGVNAQGETDKIMAAAKEGLIPYLQQIPAGSEEKFGFNDRQQFSQTTLGMPYQVYLLNASFYDATIIEPYQEYIIPANEYRIPVEINGEYRCLLTVAKMNEQWQAVSIGASDLARNLDHVDRIFSGEKHKILLRLLQLEAEVALVHPDHMKAFLLPSAFMAFQLPVDADRLIDLDMLLQMAHHKILINKQD
ncbi:MAG: hypothetical protein WBP41_20450 [Saprospiraceae bacterium]